MRFGFMAVVVLGLTLGCGQKGSLYLRDNPPPGMRPAAKTEPAYKPVPYPNEPQDESEAGKK